MNDLPMPKPSPAPPALDPCPVCTDPLPAGSRKCKTCGALRSWTADCASCGTPIPAAATVCHECVRYPRDQRSCAACGQTLPPGARTCGSCHALQIGRGWLHLSQNTLSLLVAFASSITSLVALAAAVEPFADSKTTLSYQGMAANVESAAPPEERRFSVLAINDGNRPAGVVRGELIVDKGPPLPLTIVEPPLDRRIVEAEHSATVVLGLPMWNPQQFGVANRADASFERLLCRSKTVSVVVKEYHGEETRRVRMPPRALETLLCRAASSVLGDTAATEYCELRQPCQPRIGRRR